MKEALYLVGAFFIIASVLVCVGGLYEVVKKRERPSTDALFHALGIASAFVWFLILFGLVSWGIASVFSGGLALVDWVSQKTKIPFILVLISPVMILFLFATVMNLIRRKSATNGSNAGWLLKTIAKQLRLTRKTTTLVMSKNEKSALNIFVYWFEKQIESRRDAMIIERNNN